jgi:predicted DNA-binding transcriptional regulator AlpA
MGFDDSVDAIEASTMERILPIASRDTQIAKASGLTREALYKALRPDAQLNCPKFPRPARASGNMASRPLPETGHFAWLCLCLGL